MCSAWRKIASLIKSVISLEKPDLLKNVIELSPCCSSEKLVQMPLVDLVSQNKAVEASHAQATAVEASYTQAMAVEASYQSSKTQLNYI